MDELRIIHDSQNMKFRSPFGAVEIQQKVKLSIEMDRDVIVAVELLKGNEPIKNIGMNKEYLNNGSYKYSAVIDTSNYTGIIEYYFVIIDGYSRLYYGNNDERLGGVGRVYNYDPIPYQITVYEKSIMPNWYKEGVIYQIFVDRFFNGNEEGKIISSKSNSFIYGSWNDSPMYIKDSSGRIIRWDFYGGNLKGVINKLDYLRKLGISIIYLNPIFKASSCHKYDTGDYEIVDEMFGTNEDFKVLCTKAKEMGIRIILDGVFSHTGADSKYFNKFGNYETTGAYQSPSSPYYSWYRFINYPQSYECWWGVDNQPNVEEMEPSYVEYIIKGNNSIIKKWMDLGASGWRLDVADELPDEFIRMIKEKMNEVSSDNVLIGEVWEDASNKISYSKRRRYLYGRELDSVTNYPLRENLINFVKGYIKSDKFAKKVLSLFENYPRENFYGNMNIISTHDTERIFTVLDKRIELLKIIIALQMTLPGVPLIYYGDEAGLEGGKDPENRRAYPWGRESKEIIDFYKVIIGIRNNENALKKGDFKFYNADLDVCVFERCYESERIIVAVNISERRITLDNVNIEGSYIDILDKNKEYKGLGINNILTLDGYGVKVLKGK
ncbi:glycoside hydrolase family 13 protein [Clostridium cibarium]|uniref:Glycoside hydrolase family 13 protein n=1 Tax=Clostridium cibarium TaxID=2762247 RepID=A0ABR8PZ47_9CLOT|nr:glycoside hydrolase family 13 protein [Clostridium cibarium]MBD7913451.1 glycoside hydrolase family 13 protein [Clostridium cibarium]